MNETRLDKIISLVETIAEYPDENKRLEYFQSLADKLTIEELLYFGKIFTAESFEEVKSMDIPDPHIEICLSIYKLLNIPTDISIECISKSLYKKVEDNKQLLTDLFENFTKLYKIING